jgi:zinc transport system substrate-binding protein
MVCKCQRLTNIRFILSFWIILTVCLFLFFSSCKKDESESPRLEVITTSFPVYDFSRQIGGDRVHIILISPPAAEAQTFEPSPQDVKKINQADVFVYTGKYMEPWVKEILSGIGYQRLVSVDTSSGIELLLEKKQIEEKNKENDFRADKPNDHLPEKMEKDEGGQNQPADPHIWLDPLLAQIMVDNIVSAFSEADQDNAQIYNRNGEQYKQELLNLHNKITEVILQCENKVILYSGHFAFGYFAKRYELEHESPYPGFAQDAELTPENIAEIIEKINEQGIKVIYHEESIEPAIAKIIAEKTGAEMILLNNINSVSEKELDEGVTYLSIMEDNLEKLKIGLEYK